MTSKERAHGTPGHVAFGVVGLILLLIGGALFLRFGPSPPVVPARDTTYITTHLAEDGLPDYPACVKGKLATLDPESNAAVFIWRALGPHPLDPSHRQAWFELLGIEPLPEVGDYYTSTGDRADLNDGCTWLIQHWKSSSEERVGEDPAAAQESGSETEAATLVDALESERAREMAMSTYSQLLDNAQTFPWTASQLPTLDAWVQKNMRPLDLACKASKCPQLVSPLLTSGSPLLLSNILYTEQEVRDLARGLAIRARWHLGEGRFAEAQEDVLAIHRLARLVSQQNNSLIAHLVGIALDATACRAHIAIAADPNTPRELLLQSLQEVQKLKPWDGVADIIDDAERVIALDAIVGGVRQPGLLQERDPQGKIDLRGVDLNLILREVNHAYDELSAAMRLPRRSDRQARAGAINRNLNAQLAALAHPKSRVGGVFSRRSYSRHLSLNFIQLMLPAAAACGQAEDRARMHIDLLTIALALAIYRQDHGTYPQTLEQLSPEILKEVPLDLYTDAPLRYELRDNGYLLYSLFEDRDDDHGTDMAGEIISGEWTADQNPKLTNGALADLVIRVPVPKLQVPSQPPSPAP